jgi:hypothetical protein
MGVRAMVKFGFPNFPFLTISMSYLLPNAHNAETQDDQSNNTNIQLTMF